jgi:hypothetical protein
MERMTFLALFRDKKHKFKNGYWTWHENALELKFHSHETSEDERELSERDRKQQTSAVTEADKQQQQRRQRRKNHCDSSDVGLRFVNRIDETEERIFRQFFQRPNSSSCADCDVITLEDIRNLSLFTLRSRITMELLELLLSSLIDAFFQL